MAVWCSVAVTRNRFGYLLRNVAMHGCEGGKGGEGGGRLPLLSSLFLPSPLLPLGVLVSPEQLPSGICKRVSDSCVRACVFLLAPACSPAG